MANWLDKALGRKEVSAVAPVPFVRVCSCGLATKGQRRERAQRVICSQCGMAHFVLPVNLYPASERKPFDTSDSSETAAARRQNAPDRSANVDFESPTDADDLFIDPPEEATEPELDLVESAWSKNENQAAYADEDLDEDDDYELADSDAEIELNPLPARPKKKKTVPRPMPAVKHPTATSKEKPARRLQLPAANDSHQGQRLRIVAVTVLIIFVVGAAIAWSVRERGLEQAEIAMREGRDIGEAALNNRDFATARGKLREAFEAMELLGIEDEARERTRFLWLQAEAGFGLLDSTDVVEIALAAEEAEPTGEDADDGTWQRQFRAQYFDRWLCIQLDPVEVISGDQEFGKRAIFPVQPAIHLVGIDAVLEDQSGGRLWFAGPLKTCQRDPADASAWMIEFDSSRVIACDGTEPLIRPMLTEEQQNAALAALTAASSSPGGKGDNQQLETGNE